MYTVLKGTLRHKAYDLVKVQPHVPVIQKVANATQHSGMKTLQPACVRLGPVATGGTAGVIYEQCWKEFLFMN